MTRTVEKRYDGATGLLAADEVEPGNTALNRTITYDRTGNAFGLVSTTYDNWKDPYSATDQSRVATTVYDAAGRFVASATNASGHSETFQYEPGSGARYTRTDANQLTTIWTVDGFGRVQKQLAPDINETRHYIKRCDSACPAGAVVAEITEHFNGEYRTATPQVSYADTAGHVLQVQSWGFDGRAVIADQTYDSMGRLYEQYWPRFEGDKQYLQRRTYYDALNRPEKVETLDDAGTGNSATTSYTGMVTQSQNQKQQQRKEERNVIGQLQKVTDSAKGETSFTYDPFGNLLTTIDPMGNKSKVTYDLLGRRTDLKHPDLGEIHYEVDPLGRVWKTVSPKQRAANTYTRVVFDKLDRMVERYETDLESHWVYDTEAHGIGQLAEAFTGKPDRKDYRRLHTYDDKGRPSSTTQYINGDSFASSNGWDAWGRLLQQKLQRNDDLAKAFDYRYNDKGYLARIERDGLALWSVSSQDAANRVVSSKLGNLLQQTRAFGANTGLPSSALLETAANQRRFQEDHTFDALGNILQRSQYWEETGYAEVFTYDQLNRIESSEIVGRDRQGFSYDASGNIKTKTKTNAAGVLVANMVYSYPTQGSARPHAVTSISGQGEFAYDENGNQKTAPNRTALWTSFDMPVRLTKGGVAQSFVYGPEHQRVRMDRTDNNTAIIYGGGAGG